MTIDQDGDDGEDDDGEQEYFFDFAKQGIFSILLNKAYFRFC